MPREVTRSGDDDRDREQWMARLAQVIARALIEAARPRRRGSATVEGRRES